MVGVIRRRKNRSRIGRNCVRRESGKAERHEKKRRQKEGKNRKGRKGGLNSTIHKTLLELFLDFHTKHGGPHLKYYYCRQKRIPGAYWSVRLA